MTRERSHGGGDPTSILRGWASQGHGACGEETSGRPAQAWTSVVTALWLLNEPGGLCGSRAAPSQVSGSHPGLLGCGTHPSAPSPVRQSPPSSRGSRGHTGGTSPQRALLHRPCARDTAAGAARTRRRLRSRRGATHHGGRPDTEQTKPGGRQVPGLAGPRWRLPCGPRPRGPSDERAEVAACGVRFSCVAKPRGAPVGLGAR